jgi:hypothetical protein
MRHLPVALVSLALVSACVASETGRADHDPPTSQGGAAAGAAATRARSADTAPKALPLA